MRQKPGVPVIYSVRPLGHGVLKVKLGKGPLDRGSDISDYFLPRLQAPRNLGIRETAERAGSASLCSSRDPGQQT